MGQVGQVVYDVIEPSCGKGVTFIGRMAVLAPAFLLSSAEPL